MKRLSVRGLRFGGIVENYFLRPGALAWQVLYPSFELLRKEHDCLSVYADRRFLIDLKWL